MCNIPQVQSSSFLLFSALCLFELMFLSFLCVLLSVALFSVVTDLLLKAYESATVFNSILAAFMGFPTNISYKFIFSFFLF